MAVSSDFKKYEIAKDQYSIIELNGKDGLGAKASEIKRILNDDRERIYIILDTDGNSYEKKREKFENDLQYGFKTIRVWKDKTLSMAF
ncbi:hypothetical protein [Helicobacter pylori]|uniref:hypothetical protein n=1 Tax=Helicobacter pylori TaxID=210 RepID=UPI002739C028|nr:hypothetical protein [Helicobacter pylori]